MRRVSSTLRASSPGAQTPATGSQFDGTPTDAPHAAAAALPDSEADAAAVTTAAASTLAVARTGNAAGMGRVTEVGEIEPRRLQLPRGEAALASDIAAAGQLGELQRQSAAGLADAASLTVALDALDVACRRLSDHAAASGALELWGESWLLPSLFQEVKQLRQEVRARETFERTERMGGSDPQHVSATHPSVPVPAPPPRPRTEALAACPPHAKGAIGFGAPWEQLLARALALQLDTERLARRLLSLELQERDLGPGAQRPRPGATLRHTASVIAAGR